LAYLTVLYFTAKWWSSFLVERYYVRFVLWHVPAVCHLSVCNVAPCSEILTVRQYSCAI